jgi:hypothetical protein
MAIRETMLRRQAGRCALCSFLTLGYWGAALDHCHRSGRLRGLVCYSCNRRLGLLEAGRQTPSLTEEWIELARRYLARAALRRI